MLTVVSLISGCGAVIKSRYYQPSIPPGSQLDSKEWGNGLAVATGNICVWAGEANTSYQQIVSEGPLGLPIIPRDLSKQTPERTPIALFEIWLTVDKNYSGYAINPNGITLSYSDGVEKQPDTIQISRMKTKWEQPYFHILPAKDVEHLDLIEAVKTEALSKPVDLWNWTRINVSFSRNTSTPIPEQIQIQIHGLQHNGSDVNVPSFKLKDIETTTYQVAGNFKSPADPCRDLFRMHNSK